MMISSIDGAQRPPDDDQVQEALRRAGARDPIYGASVLIALNNTQGEVYSLVHCQGARQTKRVTECLRGLGFAEMFAPGSTFHYTFRR